jgi:hypothetical protein
MADGSTPTETLRLAAPLVEDYGHVCRNLRTDERVQFLAMSGLAEYHADVAARAMLAVPGPAFALVGAGNLPVVIGGFEPVRPGVYQTWMAGTDEGWTRYWRGITKMARQLVTHMLETDAQRVQDVALASRRRAHEWYRRALGMHYEGTHAAFYADGSDAVCYARVRQ